MVLWLITMHLERSMFQRSQKLDLNFAKTHAPSNFSLQEALRFPRHQVRSNSRWGKLWTTPTPQLPSQTFHWEITHYLTLTSWQGNPGKRCHPHHKMATGLPCQQTWAWWFQPLSTYYLLSGWAGGLWNSVLSCCPRTSQFPSSTSAALIRKMSWFPTAPLAISQDSHCDPSTMGGFPSGMLSPVL